MDKHMQAAYIMAQTAMMQAETEGMRSENLGCLVEGAPLLYRQEEWNLHIKNWEKVLGHDAIVGLTSPESLIITKRGMN
jgi:hypothetical protein